MKSKILNLIKSLESEVLQIKYDLKINGLYKIISSFRLFPEFKSLTLLVRNSKIARACLLNALNDASNDFVRAAFYLILIDSDQVIDLSLPKNIGVITSALKLSYELKTVTSVAVGEF